MKTGRSAPIALSICLAAFSLAASIEDLKEDAQIRRTADRRVRPMGPWSSSTALRALGDCEDVRSYLIDVAVERVLEYRYGWLWWGPPWAGAEDDRGVHDVPSDFTTTNNQEQGVDEIDIVKTNGTHLYAVEEENLHVMLSWPAEVTSEIATVATPNYGRGLFLRGDRVLVASDRWSSEDEPTGFLGGIRFSLFDVSHPASPVLLRTIDIEGWLADARLIDGDLYAVVRSNIELPSELWDLAWRDDLGLPDLPWDVSDAERDRILDEARSILQPLVEEIMAAFSVDEFLPRVLDVMATDPKAIPQPLLECESLYRPADASDWAVLSVVHLDLDDDRPLAATGLIADGWTVYASTTNLYVAQTSDWWWWGWMPAPSIMKTVIHKFELEPTSPDPVRYAASGSVDGWILDQFSLSEHEGLLRVAATEFDWWWGTTPDEERASSVTVLTDDGSGSLREVGQLGGLGPGEQIYAVRFMGDTGYVVTFRQVDPLFTVDLSDPYFPKLVGELEVTGFSSYLHPIGEEWLLAVGQEADTDGRVVGLAVSVFDVRDLAMPRLAHRYLIEGDDDTWSWSEALNDHHAFTYHRGVLSIPAYINGAEQRFSGLIVLAVDPEDGIRELGRIDHQDLVASEGDTWIRRSIYIEDAIYSLSSAGVKVNSLVNPEVELARVPFGE